MMNAFLLSLIQTHTGGCSLKLVVDDTSWNNLSSLTSYLVQFLTVEGVSSSSIYNGIASSAHATGHSTV
eukprot:m.11088 g.11088  ORF g.11088 m.11088 type:complete len:69 (+) comp5666_c0_seq1:83-289(+)